MADVDTQLSHIRITQKDLLTEAKLRFGDDLFAIAFRCPHCDDVATIAEFRDLQVDPGRAGQECIGRHLGALDKKHAPGEYTGRGCNWAAYGLLRGPWEITLTEGRSMWAFPLAGEPHPDGPVIRTIAEVIRTIAEKAEVTR
ncbi:VVA0879 family protein [Actinoplanes sp. NPDC051861]|uniref:VVA0879 family protein n=1 Tax=Actinoplanes sp. NPDC051861 TaxID=3155170 RepID=UPI003429C863